MTLAQLERVLPATGEMAQRVLAHDWAATPMGAVDGWPRELVDALALMLPAQAEIVLFWGPDYIAFYNDAYAPTIGDKHPAAQKKSIVSVAYTIRQLSLALPRLRSTARKQIIFMFG